MDCALDTVCCYADVLLALCPRSEIHSYILCFYETRKKQPLHYLPVGLNKGFLSCFLSVKAALGVKVTSGGN